MLLKLLEILVIKFLVGENVPSAEIHHRLQQQYGEECDRLPLSLLTAYDKVRTVCKTVVSLGLHEDRTS